MPLRPLARCTLAFALAALLLAAPSIGAAWDWNGAAWADYRSFLGPIDAPRKARLRAIVVQGVAAGRVAGRMGQIGDSITESSAYFRNAILSGPSSNETGHDYAAVRSWLAYSGTQPADGNSFYRDHGKGPDYGNLGGWEIADAEAAGHPPAGVLTGDGTTPGEYSWALLMFGTNDIDEGGWSAAAWKATYRTFVQGYVDLGVVPVLSTIPPELAHVGDGRVEAANVAVVQLADEMLVPWVDYHALILHFQPQNWLGTLIGADGTHPTAATGGRGFSFVAQSSTDGYALRTKLTFDAAEKLRAIVFEDGVPDGAVTGARAPEPLVLAGLDVRPNPCRGATSLRARLGGAFPATLRIVDAVGRTVRTWRDAPRLDGTYEHGWDARDEAGRPVAAGVYFVAWDAGSEHRVARIVVVR
ncbi:MAG: GDSL-type esterase/lipase family protein [bacterium]